MGIRSYFIQYKFIIPENIKHSSYTYQKLFRALYGYTQAVFKSNGKVYHYHRNGVLSDSPYIRPGKNCVIIPPGAFQKLIDFFKTGHNPTHQWRGKGEWKAVYYMNEKDVDEKKIAEALESLLSRLRLSGSSSSPLALTNALHEAASDSTVAAKPGQHAELISLVKPIVESEWFKSSYTRSSNLKGIYSDYKILKGI